MSDHRPPEPDEIEHDPMDAAYRDAELVLNGAAERSRRRADVLKAVGQFRDTPVVSSAPARPPVRRPRRWGRTAWIPAGAAAGLSLFLAVKIDPLVRRQNDPEPTAPSPPAPETPSFQPPGAPPPSTPTRAAAPRAAGSSPAPRRKLAHADRPSPQASVEPIAPHMTPPPPLNVPAPPAPLPPVRAPMPEAIAPPAPAPPAPPAPPASPTPATTPSKRVSEAPQAFPASETPTEAGAPSELGEALRRASRAGRIDEVETLIIQGAVIDAADGDGETALMESIRADHPDVAATLRRHGASLDRTDRSGQSARDMAARGDAKLRQALGLEP